MNLFIPVNTSNSRDSQNGNFQMVEQHSSSAIEKKVFEVVKREMQEFKLKINQGNPGP